MFNFVSNIIVLHGDWKEKDPKEKRVLAHKSYSGVYISKQ